VGSSVINASAAKLVGRSHLETATGCQDAVSIATTRNSACIALADGAGSKKHSAIGAQTVANAISAHVVRNFDQLYRYIERNSDLALDMVMITALRALRGKAKRQGVTLDALASTLLFSAFKSGRYIAGHIGDGVVGIKTGDEIGVLSPPENGEYANTTYFITDKNARSHLRLYSGLAKEGYGAILMSDGTAESLFAKASSTLGTAVTRIFSWSEELSPRKMDLVLLANLEQVFSKKTTDDCSVAVLTARNKPSGHVKTANLA
jgi:hypothetical protein